MKQKILKNKIAASILIRILLIAMLIFLTYFVKAEIIWSNPTSAYFYVGQPTPGDLTPPSSITNLNLISKSYTWLYWNWTNPSDSDFCDNIIYLNGINVANTSENYYNATNLQENTEYTITINTIDCSGNINYTNVSNTAKTLKHETPTPKKRKSTSNQMPIIDGNSIFSDNYINKTNVVNLNNPVLSESNKWEIPGFIIILLILILILLFLVIFLLFRR